MSRLLPQILILLFCTTTFAQDVFKSGYFINNDGHKTNTLIKDKDWLNTPDQFEYKLSENSETNVLNINNIREVMIGEDINFQRYTVNYDQSRQEPKNLSSVRNPEYLQETVFLKTLLEGNASLFSHTRYGREVFFYRLGDGEVKQLINKAFNPGDGKIRYNSKYKQDLWNDLKCETIPLGRIEKINYTSKDLIDFFQDYNECKGATVVLYNYVPQNKKSGEFHLSVKTGLNFNSLHIYNPKKKVYVGRPGGGRVPVYYPEKTIYEGSDFDLSFRAGVELRYVLPYFNRKWAIFMEPTYQQYSAEKEMFPNGNLGSIKYSAVELPLGVRHSFFINNTSNIFLNAGAGYTYSYDHATTENYNTNTSQRPGFKLENTFSLLAFTGVGYTHKYGFNLEIRYYPLKEITRKGDTMVDHNNSFSIIAGYQIF